MQNQDEILRDIYQYIQQSKVVTTDVIKENYVKKEISKWVRVATGTLFVLLIGSILTITIFNYETSISVKNQIETVNKSIQSFEASGNGRDGLLLNHEGRIGKLEGKTDK